MQDLSRKLLQIDDSATTVDAAPLSSANASSSGLSFNSSNDTKPHTILSDVVSAYKAKFTKRNISASAPVSSMSSPSASATATANATADSGDDYYSTPCSSSPIPSQYKAFVEVRMLPCFVMSAGSELVCSMH